MQLFHPYQEPDPMVLQFALMVYANRNSGVVMRHPVSLVHGEAQLGVGAEVTHDVIEQLLKLTDKRPMTVVPPNVVGVAREAVAWFVPAGERRLLFNADRDQSVRSLDGLVFPQPPLVFVARARSLCVYALKENERPGADTPLVRAPYYNVFDNDSVCLGTMKTPEVTDVGRTAEWTEAFFSSNFTHRTGNAVRWASRGTHTELWLAAKEKGSFDPEWLVPAGKTLEAAVCGR